MKAENSSDSDWAPTLSAPEVWMQKRLDQRKAEGALRTLQLSEGKIDFCSNDYLGFAQSKTLHETILQELAQVLPPQTGSTGSRLISGNSLFLEKLEQQIAHFHHAASGLIFNSGYDLNVGFFSALPQRSDTVFYDKLVHASIRDGLRLGVARHFSFRHNDLDHLREKIQVSGTGQIFIAVESVYSMDGDFSPLESLVSLCKETGAALVVDEAHATGVFGEQGKGRVAALGLEEAVFARIHTFGKALGTHGAIVLGSQTLRTYLINYARPLIYSTALPLHSLISIRCAYQLLQQSQTQINGLHQLIHFFKSKLPSFSDMTFLVSESAIQGLVLQGNNNVKAMAWYLQQSGYDVRPILSPTVPSGKERLRICLHAHNTQRDVEQLLQAITQFKLKG
ncbi:8-amino-7-oxononanoate synthase [Deltaproteobacteria bacterium TL4]